MNTAVSRRDAVSSMVLPKNEWFQSARGALVAVMEPSTQVEARAPSPKVIHTHFDATTMRDDLSLIITSLIVAGVKRSL